MKIPIVKFGTFANHRKEFIRIDDFTQYTRARVQLHWRGIVERDRLEGAAIKTKDQQVARTGELLVAEIDAKVGGIGIVPRELDGAVVSSHYFLFEIDETKCLRKWLDYFVRSGALEDQVAARGSTNYAAIRPQHVLSFEMPLLPIPEQRRIVARIEELSAKFEEAHNLRRQAVVESEVMIHANVSKIDVSIRKTHSLSRLEDFASREKGSLRSGPFGSALLHNEFVTDGVPAIGIQDVKENQFELSRKWNVTVEKAEELRRYTIKPRDLLVTVMGTLGRACVVPDEVPRMVSTKHVWTITLDQNKAEPRWVSYWINYSRLVREELLGQGTGTAIPGLNGEKLRNLLLPKLPLTEQHRIVAYLDDLQAKVDTVMKLQEESEQELNALMSSILSRAFAGEL